MNPQSISWFSFHHLLFIINLLILFMVPNGSSDPALYYQTCGKTFSCGSSITGIGFPFRRVNDPLYCGHPSFSLTCDDQTNRTSINITSTKYGVLEIDQNNQTMRIAREDIIDKTCPTEKVNTTLDYSIFDYDASSRNLTFLYGCPPDRIPGIMPIQCANESVYVLSGSMGPGDCNESVIIPVNRVETGGTGGAGAAMNAVGLDQALKQGFQIKYKVDSEACSDCTASKGRCGYDVDRNLPVCYCPHPPYISDRTCTTTPNNPSSPKGSSGPAIVGTLLSVTGTVIFTVVVVCYLKRRCSPAGNNQKENNQDIEKILLQYGSLAPKRYKYSKIKKITKSFKEKLGHGGYGSVYKGMLPDGTLVAVKLLTETDGDGEEFINEVASISRTSHVNIVTLLGFCYDKNKKALVYEFMPNRSLDKFLSNADCRLDLNKLYKIAVGIAKGLEYLHTGCTTRIVHFDIKPQNILLDEDLCPKISDFGLAKLCKKRQSILSVLGTRGTIGYIAPEMFSRNFGGVSHKSDVYSYGMMVLEMAGAKKIVEGGAVQSSENYFPDKIYEHVLLGVTSKVDDFVIENEDEIAKKLFLVGFWCIQTTPSDRPTMCKVVEMLEGRLQSIPIPPKPFLFSPDLPEQEISSSFSKYVEAENSAES